MRNNKMLALAGRIEKFFELRLPALVLSMALAATLNVAFAKVNVGSDGVAIHGYDIVAYFLEGRAAQGTTEFEHSWRDAKWRFSNEANKNLFVADPERYVPQYGGFCAVCLALDGELTDANPKAWTIVDGKLYLNYSMHQRTQWRIRSDVYVKLGDEAWAGVVAQESRPEKSEALFRIAVMAPYRPGRDARGLNLGSDIYGSILQRPSFSIEFADEPDDPSALSFLNRGGDWPYPSTGIEAIDAWEVSVVRAGNKPKIERLFEAGRDLEVEAILMWDYDWGTFSTNYPIRIHLIDVDKRRVYEHEGTTNNPEEPVRRAFEDFLAGREGYRIAVMQPAFFYPHGGAPNPNIVGSLGGDIYQSIRQQPAFSITHADEPFDPSALGYLNRGGDWPFPPTNVDPKEAWQGNRTKKTPNLDRLYRAGDELGVDAVMMWHYRTISDHSYSQYPVEVYAIDVEKQRVYVHEGKSTGVGALVQQALDDFLAGRKP